MAESKGFYRSIISKWCRQCDFIYAIVKASEIRGFGITFEMLGLHAWNKKMAASA